MSGIYFRLFCLAAAFLSVAAAQSELPYLISTFAGGQRLPFPGQGSTATDVRFVLPQDVAVDSSGNIYVSDSYYDRVLRITPAGAVSTFAGSETGFGGDGGVPSAAQFNGVFGIAFSPAGELHICDSRNGRVRKISRDGNTITTVAGTGSVQANGDGGPATQAALGNPRSIVFDSAGNYYISDTLNHVVRKVDQAGVITTVAGTAGRRGFGGDGAAATSALLQVPAGLAVDAQNNLYIADSLNNRIRRVTTQNGRIETFAGTGVQGFAGSNSPAASAQFYQPLDLAFNRNGDLFIADRNNGRIRRIRGGTITTVAGGGSNRAVPGSAVQFDLAFATAVAVDANDQLLVLDDGLRRLFRVNPVSDQIQAAAGTSVSRAAGDGGPASQATLFEPSGVAVDSEGNVFVSDVVDNRVRRIARDGTIGTWAGTGSLGTSGDGGPATAAGLGRPRGMAIDRNQNLYVAGTWGAYIRRISPRGVITNFAGTTSSGFSGDGGAATAARLNEPFGVAVDNQDNVYIADSANHRIRRVDPQGRITTFAGTGTAGFSGDGGPAVAAQLTRPRAVAVDNQGNVFIADTNNNRVRRVDSRGIITTVAGNGETGSSGVGRAGTESQIWAPSGLAFDSEGSLLISVVGQVRSLGQDGIVRLVAGGATTGLAGDGGPGNAALLSAQAGIAVGPDGSIFVADQSNERVRRLALVRLTADGIANQASGERGAVAANEIVAIQGLRLGPATAVTGMPDSSGRYPKTLGGTEVTFDGVPAALLSAQERIVYAAVPASVSGDRVRVRVAGQGSLTEEISVPVRPAIPGVYTRTEDGLGPALARNEDDSDNSEANPAAPGSLVRFRVTGLGTTAPALDDGQVAGADDVIPTNTIEVTIGGAVAELVSARVPEGQLAGVVEITVRVPSDVEFGSTLQPLLVRSGDFLSQAGVTIAVAQPQGNPGVVPE
ncbi:MAG: SMP-30/gluconolactonase/LRE family protein [Bryobacterales bacterium]|nr:SMP-30/gluconolactonase/LRE family protein [Bryobacterales bacterium]